MKNTIVCLQQEILKMSTSIQAFLDHHQPSSSTSSQSGPSQLNPGLLSIRPSTVDISVSPDKSTPSGKNDLLPICTKNNLARNSNLGLFKIPKLTFPHLMVTMFEAGFKNLTVIFSLTLLMKPRRCCSLLFI